MEHSKKRARAAGQIETGEEMVRAQGRRAKAHPGADGDGGRRGGMGDARSGHISRVAEHDVWHVVLIDTVDTEEFCGIQNVLASICARESTDLAMPGGI